MSSLPPLKRVSATELRRMFNAGSYWERVKEGRYTERILSNGHPSPPLAKEPFCTRSQFIAYYDENNKKIAAIHQYLRQDGTLGLGGRPDPKELYVDGVLYVLPDYGQSR